MSLFIFSDLLKACMNPSPPKEGAAPIGFNLPEEFQDRVRITEGQNLYPPLNMSTAGNLNFKHLEFFFLNRASQR